MGDRIKKGKAKAKDRKYIKESYNSEKDYRSEHLTFSLKYLDLNDSDFCVNDCHTKYFIALLARIGELSRYIVCEFKENYKKALRNHEIKWEDVTRDCFGIPNEVQIVDKPWQFGVSANENGRVIGFFIDNVFYVRWLDYNHNLYD
ncbi:hypothetical protein [Dehalobacter sp. CF]|jgi:hypothetical protein|uniref:hypothetical protein n=1 Tax=Dehalobacter sp. CF TaxID=1131462 RepID=UPI00059BD9C7|nr:hypothetical protein [Dehalobacter sp. CF]